MVFRKDIDPYCIYCKHGTAISDEAVACIKHGVVESSYSCRSFCYAPLKRKPPRPARFKIGKLNISDFSLTGDG